MYLQKKNLFRENKSYLVIYIIFLFFTLYINLNYLYILCIGDVIKIFQRQHSKHIS